MALRTDRTSESIAGVGENIGSDSPWSNPGNITADDSNTADWQAASGGEESDTLRARDFGFSLPDNAEIDGVLATFDATTSGALESQILLRTDSENGENKAGNNTLQETYGGSEDVWSMDLTPDVVNGSDFGLDVSLVDESGGDATAEMDFVQLTVFWHYDVSVDPAEVPRREEYKVYNRQDRFLGKLPNVQSKLAFAHDIDSVGAKLDIECAATVDTTGLPPIALGSLVGWLDGWSYRKKITVPKENVDSNITSFQVYVDLSALDDDFWNNTTSSVGFDIRVTTETGTSVLPHEVNEFDQNNKEGELWFKADLSSVASNVFYVYYGNGDASHAEKPGEVWEAYTGVWHMRILVDEFGNETVSDSTDNNNTAEPVGDPQNVEGKIETAIDFDGTDDYLSLPSGVSSGMAGATDYSLSCWIKFTTVGAPTNLSIVLGVNTASGDNVLLFGVRGGTTVMAVNETSSWEISGSTDVTDGEWHYVTYVRDGSTGTLYVDGQSEGAHTADHTYSTDDTWSLGQEFDSSTPTDFFDGMIDEFRIRSNSVTTEWLETEYANQDDPSSFYTVGDQQEQEEEDTGDVLMKNGNLVEAWIFDSYHPNGKRMFVGQINRVQASIAADTESIVKLMVLSDGRDLDNYLARSVPLDVSEDVSQTSENSSFELQDDVGWKRCGQTWVISSGINRISQIRLRLKGSANVKVGLRSGPNGSIIDDVDKFVDTGSLWEDVDFSFFSPIEVETDEEHFFSVQVDDSESILIAYSDSNPYSGGAMYISDYSGVGGDVAYEESSGDDLYFVTYGGELTTTADFLNEDPTTGMLQPIMEDYRDRGGNIEVTDESIEATGLSLDYTYRSATVFDVIKKTRELAPSGFYYYVDLGEKRLYFKEVSAEPDILLTKGRHVGTLDLTLSIEDVVNSVLFSGGDTGGGDNLYSTYRDVNSMDLYGTRLEQKSDNRVTVQETADAMSDSLIEEKKDEQQDTTVNILAETMDLTTIKPGMTIGFRGYGTFIDELVLKATRVNYSGEMVEVKVGTMPVRYNDRIENIIKGLLAEQTINNPDQPS